MGCQSPNLLDKERSRLVLERVEAQLLHDEAENPGLRLFLGHDRGDIMLGKLFLQVLLPHRWLRSQQTHTERVGADKFGRGAVGDVEDGDGGIPFPDQGDSDVSCVGGDHEEGGAAWMRHTSETTSGG